MKWFPAVFLWILAVSSLFVTYHPDSEHLGPRVSSALGACALIASEPQLCLRCHDEAVHKGPNHPWGIEVPVNTDPGVPLFDGKMTCSS